MLKVVHCSDVHIRSLQYHEEYKRGLENFYRSLKEMNPDLIVMAGDLIHTKTNISADLIDMLFYMFSLVSKWPTIVLPGNHDYNVRNSNRKNILEVLRDRVGENVTISGTEASHLYQVNGSEGEPYQFHMIPCGVEIEPIKEDEATRVVVWHGMVASSRNDIGYRFTGIDSTPLSEFNSYHYGMFGDIHKRQFLDDKNRFAYCGSLFQQDFGEEVEKGYLLWTLEGKDKHRVDFKPIEAGKNFYCYDYNKLDLDGPLLCLPGSKVRIQSKNSLESSAKRKVRETFNAIGVKEIIYRVQPDPISRDSLLASKEGVERIEDLKDLANQRNLISNFCKGDARVLKAHDFILSRLESSIKADKSSSLWTVKKIEWENLFSYKGNSCLEFGELPGTIGVFGENKAGKSSICDILTWACYGQTIRPVPRISDILTKGETCSANARVELVDEQGRELTIGRELSRGKGKNSKSQTTMVVDGITTTGESETTTKKLICELLGSFEDYLLLSILSVDRPEFSIVGSFEKPTFKDTLRRLLGIDVFDNYEVLSRQLITTTERDIISISNSLEKMIDVVGDLEATKREAAICQKQIGDLKSRLVKANQSRQARPLRETLQTVPCSDLTRETCKLYQTASGQCLKAPTSDEDPVYLQQQLEELESNLLGKNRLIGALQQSTKDKKELQKRQASLDKLLEALKLYKDVVGRNGVSLQILKDLLRGLETSTNNIIESITPDFKIEIEYEGDSISISLMDVAREQTSSRPVSLGSGMEKLTVEIAFRVALLQLSNAPRLSLFLIDERLSVLDSNSLGEVASLFDYMESFFSNIVVITHNRDLKDTVRHALEVAKRDGVSTIDG